MNRKKHSLSMSVEQVGNEFLFSLKAIGKLTHEDYQAITPVIDAALAEIKEPKVILLVDCTELEGWELRAAWDDFKIGLKHGNEFKKVAVYGNREWQEVTAKMGSWFISGEIDYFENLDDAMEWLYKR